MGTSVGGLRARNATRKKITRLELEMNQFNEESYYSEFSKVIHLDENTVKVTFVNGKTYTVYRDTNFLDNPPEITDENGNKLERNSDWSPAYTSAKWLLMLLTHVPSKK